MTRAMWILLGVISTSECLAGTTTLQVRAYDKSTNVWAVPPTLRMPKEDLQGSFGAEYVSDGRLQFVSSFETRLSQWRGTGAAWFTIGSVYFHIGARYHVTPRIMFEAKHGSWHAVDARGSVERYNHIGMEVKL